MNTFGNKLRLTTFGESHGPAMGGVIDGFPAGFKINFDSINSLLSERKPGSSPFTSHRKEPDVPEFLSGISKDGITLGSPIAFIIRNSDARSADYENIRQSFRPNHADFTYYKKYGLLPQAGGGRSSARETVNWVVGGAICIQFLETKGINIDATITGIGHEMDNDYFHNLITQPSIRELPKLDEKSFRAFGDILDNVMKRGDSVGGRITGLISGLKAGIGDPVFNKLHSRLASAMMSINAAKAFEFGAGFEASQSFGSETADCPDLSTYPDYKFTTNFSGGIQGGISNGMPVFFSVYFKPTPSIRIALPSFDIYGNPCEISTKGRHDPCVALRALPVVKAMTALVVTDFLL